MKSEQMSEFKDKSLDVNSYKRNDYDNIRRSEKISQQIYKDSTKVSRSYEFNVNDVPLPDNPFKDKSKKNRKRKNEIGYSDSRNYPKDPKKHCSSAKAYKRQFEVRPNICSNRSVNRYGSTWGERSVNSFKIMTEIGEGTYGHVFKAIDRETQRLRALKKVRLEHEKEGFPITTVREIKILQKLNHQNIVEFLEVVTDYDIKNDKTSNKGFYLVFEYMDHDLYGIIDSGIEMSEIQISSIIKQILEGVNYCHKKMFLHRDLKCSNILMNSKGEVKIADFGLARPYDSDNKKRPYTNRVITLWYRAPELLLGEECYGHAVDIWSIGCIMGELFTHRTMFQASNETDQLDLISKLCGTPTKAVWPEVEKLPLFKTYKPKHTYRRRLRDCYVMLSIEALDVLDWMLQLDPKRRCSTEQVLSINWLKKVDPRKIKMIDLPKDKDFHELSCKRRQRQKNPNDPHLIRYSTKQVRSASSTANSEDHVTSISQNLPTTSTKTTSSKPCFSVLPLTKSTPPGLSSLTNIQKDHSSYYNFSSANSNVSDNNNNPNKDKKNLEVNENLLDLLKRKLQGFPNSEEIIKEFDNLSDANIQGKLQELLEPFIKEIYASNIPSVSSAPNNISQLPTPPSNLSQSLCVSDDKVYHSTSRTHTTNTVINDKKISLTTMTNSENDQISLINTLLQDNYQTNHND